MLSLFRRLFGRPVVFDQRQLHNGRLILQQIGVAHGDTARVELRGLGVSKVAPDRGKVLVSFCPAVNHGKLVQMLTPGSMAERRWPLSERFAIDFASARRIAAFAGTQGFVDVMATVSTNGRNYLSDVTVVKTHLVPPDFNVAHTESYAMYLNPKSAEAAP